MCDIAVSYGSADALRGVSAELAPGTVTALVGHNGSGKSTMLHVLAGLTPTTHGTISGLAGAVALVPQQTVADPLVPATVNDVVEMGLWPRLGLWRRPSAADRGRCAEALRRMGADGIARRRLGDLSGGQRQRTMLAQALVQRADLVLLDEPTTGLDAAARQTVDQAIRDEADRGATVVLATHEHQQAAGADVIVHLARGRVESITRAARA